MAPNDAGRRYRACYATLLRLYPRPFREQFSDAMAQTFNDMCREQGGAKRSIFGLAIWIYFETSVAILRENSTQMSQVTRMTLRVALGALAALMVPLVASQVVEGWHWRPQGFVFAYVLFFATGMAYALISGKMGAWSYKAGVGLALLAGFVLSWSNMVHVAGTENPANLLYYSVLVVGLVGAVLARLRPQGLARTLFAMAATLAMIAVVLPSGAPPDLARNMDVGHAALVVLFTSSGFMFRHASLASVS